MLLALIAATAANPQRLGGFELGQNVTRASEAATAFGNTLRPWREGSTYRVYFIIDANGNPKGSLGFCKGKLDSVNLDIQSYDNFVALLRQRIAEWGNPITNIETQEIADGSGSLELLTLNWKMQHYQIQFSAKLAQGFWGSQSIGVGNTCKNSA